MLRKITGYAILVAIYLGLTLGLPLIQGFGIGEAFLFLGLMTVGMALFMGLIWFAIDLIDGDKK